MAAIYSMQYMDKSWCTVLPYPTRTQLTVPTLCLVLTNVSILSFIKALAFSFFTSYLMFFTVAKEQFLWSFSQPAAEWVNINCWAQRKSAGNLPGIGKFMRSKQWDNRGCETHAKHILLREEVVSCRQMLMSPTELEDTPPHIQASRLTLSLLCHLLSLYIVSLTATETRTDTLNKHSPPLIHQLFGLSIVLWDCGPQHGEYT